MDIGADFKMAQNTFNINWLITHAAFCSTFLGLRFLEDKFAMCCIVLPSTRQMKLGNLGPLKVCATLCFVPLFVKASTWESLPSGQMVTAGKMICSIGIWSTEVEVRASFQSERVRNAMKNVRMKPRATIRNQTLLRTPPLLLHNVRNLCFHLNIFCWFSYSCRLGPGITSYTFLSEPSRVSSLLPQTLRQFFWSLTDVFPDPWGPVSACWISAWYWPRHWEERREQWERKRLGLIEQNKSNSEMFC